MANILMSTALDDDEGYFNMFVVYNVSYACYFTDNTPMVNHNWEWIFEKSTKYIFKNNITDFTEFQIWI